MSTSDKVDKKLKRPRDAVYYSETSYNELA